MNEELLRSLVRIRMLISLMCVLFGATASAHPGSGIVVDRDGQIFFTDTGRGIWKIDTQGKLTYLPASKFHWVAIDEAGYFVESQKNFGGWFERVTPQDSTPALIMCSDFPLTVNKDGNIYYADTRPNFAQIVRRTPDGTESVLARGKTFESITGIAAGPDSSFYFTDANNADPSVIRRITMDGTVSTITSIGRKDSTNHGPHKMSAAYCRGLAVDAQGVVFVATTGSRSVLKITAKGEVSTILQAPSPWSPTGVAVFRGEVYVLEWRDAPSSQEEVREEWIPRVRKIGRDGTITTLATVSR